MKKHVLVTVCSTFNVGGEIETSEFFTEGILYLKNKKYYLIFDTVYDEETSVKTTLIIHSVNNITLKNSGAANYTLDLEKNVSYSSIISYNGLSTNLEIYPSEIQFQMLSDGYCDIYLKYSISGDSEILSENTIEIKTKPKNK